MDKDTWRHTWAALQATCCRLETDLNKHEEEPLLKGIITVPAQQSHGGIFRRLADAKQQLADLQQLVQLEQGAANSTFIAALSDRITRFTQQLNSIKQQQRTDYAALLQQEQQLLEELSVLELTLQSEEQLQLDPQSASWHSPAGQLGSGGQHSAAAAASDRPGSAADCLSRSPDRPGRPAHAGVVASTDERSCGSSSGAGLPADVHAYDDFLARHGPTGGWHADDHKTFMAILKAHRGDYNACLAAAVEELPLQTRASVIAHCRWHADLCELEMRKRIALVNWRTAKEAAKAAFRAQAVALGDASSSAGGLVCGSPAPADQRNKGVRHVKQQLLQQWREEQAAAREAAAQAAAEQQRQRQQQERQQRQQRQEELKRQLQEARAAKQQQEQEAVAVLASQASAPQLDAEQRQRLRQRNEAAVQRQKQLLEAKKERQAARERAQQQLLAAAEGLRPQVGRDPQRLLSATTAAAARAAASAAAVMEAKEAAAQSSRGQTAGGFVLHVSHRATPGWVAGVGGL